VVQVRHSTEQPADLAVKVVKVAAAAVVEQV
jgi:hypothetical protein